MRPLCAISLIAILVLAPAMATDISEGCVFTGVETMTFQNGRFPTPDYAGIRLLGISSDSTAVTKGDMSWPGDSLVWIGDVSDLEGEDRLLFSIDLSALPDSCVIVDATLYILKTGSTVTLNEYLHVDVHRLLRPFESSATWTNRKTTPADTAWSQPGAIMASTRTRWPELYGATEYYVGAPRVEFNTSGIQLPTYAGIMIACGSDSIWSGYSQVPAYKSDALRACDITICGRWNLGGASNAVWVPMDITHLIRMWHGAFWANYGAIVVLSGCDLGWGGMQDVTFHSHLPATSAGDGPNGLVPWVVVHYLHCAW